MYAFIKEVELSSRLTRYVMSRLSCTIHAFCYILIETRKTRTKTCLFVEHVVCIQGYIKNNVV